VGFQQEAGDPQETTPASVPLTEVTSPLPQLDVETPAMADAAADPPLQLDEVLFSVADCYPLIAVAIGEVEAAEGRIISSWGEFDSILQAHSIAQPLGFYKNYRNGAGIKQPLFNGGEVYGTYRLGDGNFEPWYGERETNEGGEFRAGFSLPLAQDRQTDARRTDLLRANANRDEINSGANARLLQFQRFAMQAYWDWVAAGRAVSIRQQLLNLAEQRVQQINTRIEKGDLAEIARIDNDRFIAERTNELIKSRRNFEKAAIKLSLFYRDAGCQPVIAGSGRLPESVPEAVPVLEEQLQADMAEAVLIRPEIAALDAARAQVFADLQYARNLTLPQLDMLGFASQDVGGEASSKGDKTRLNCSWACTRKCRSSGWSVWARSVRRKGSSRKLTPSGNLWPTRFAPSCRMPLPP
jgi:hypothetical protein